MQSQPNQIAPANRGGPSRLQLAGLATAVAELGVFGEAMMLIGSLQEDQFRQELVSSHQRFLTSDDCHELRLIVTRAGFSPRTCIAIQSTPDQDSEIVTFYCHPDRILTVEIWHEGIPPEISISTRKDYLKALSKVYQIRLAVAVDILQRSMHDEK